MVVYIAGAMRSGTTVLGQLAATSPDLVFVGEVRSALLWTADARVCDCLLPRQDCPVWGRITSGPESAEQVGIEYRLSRQRPAFYRTLRKQPEIVPGLLATLRESAAPRHVVDSSKTPTGILLWRRAGESVHVVHCVRSPLAVVRAQADPATHPSGRRVPPWRSILIWISHNVLALALRPFAASYTVVRFRDLERDPAGVIRRIWSAAGVRPGAGPGTGATFDIGVSHVLAANPRRTRRGETRVRHRRPT